MSTVVKKKVSKKGTKVITVESAMKKLIKEKKINPFIKGTTKEIKDRFPGQTDKFYKELSLQFKKWEKEEQFKSNKAKAKIQDEEESASNEDFDQDTLEQIESYNKLSYQERIFCLAYLKNFSLINAANKSGYTQNEAQVLIKSCKMVEAIKSIQKMREQELYVDGLSLIRLYSQIAFSDISDYADWGCKDVPIRNSNGEIVYNKDGTMATYQTNYVKLKDNAGLDCRMIQEIKEGKDGVSIKLYDKISALEKLSKIFDIEGNAEVKNIDLEIKKARLKQEQAKARILEGNEDKELVIVHRRADIDV